MIANFGIFCVVLAIVCMVVAIVLVIAEALMEDELPEREPRSKPEEWAWPERIAGPPERDRLPSNYHTTRKAA